MVYSRQNTLSLVCPTSNLSSRSQEIRSHYKYDTLAQGHTTLLATFSNSFVNDCVWLYRAGDCNLSVIFTNGFKLSDPCKPVLTVATIDGRFSGKM